MRGIFESNQVDKRFAVFELFGMDIISAVSAWPQTTTLILADAAAIKEVSTSRSRFPKPVQHYTVLTFFGRNIVASEGEEWKKYRKISAPAFSDRNNKMVWDETVKIMDSLFDDVWTGEDTIVTDHCVEVTLPIALFVIGAAGFGRTISWKDDDTIPAGHQLTFKNALHIVTTDVFLKLIVPERALGLTQRLRDVRLAFDELERYMSEMIQQRQTAAKKEARYDLFSSLLDANDVDSEEAKLSVSELIGTSLNIPSSYCLIKAPHAGNIFIFLVAGHEARWAVQLIYSPYAAYESFQTTAHTLCFTFAMLALYQDEQETLYNHIQSVLATGNLPVTGIPKFSFEDTTLTTIDAKGNKVDVAVPKDADITIDVPGLHYNPPLGFLKTIGPETRFYLSVLARGHAWDATRYKIEVKEEPQFAHETFEQRKERILLSRPGLTLTPIRVPLVFKLRDAQAA
ncbi:hypothetical protein DXG01_012196 [Tephrocybe rancida]|nr:hypothetical protein DXG01_012196 [Tephrocybe rancida]